MDETTREERARAFGVNSKDYDAVRPGYPDQLFADLLDYAALREGARVLEIGCGTGQATRSLVDRAIDLTCLEPSETLSDLARVTFADRPNVEILTTRFEAFDSPEHDFDLVLAATSFHWLDPETRMARCALLLRPGGTLAVFSNTHPAPYTGFFEEVQRCYARHVPEWPDPTKATPSSDLGVTALPTDEFLKDGLFTDVCVHSCDWAVDFSADDYVRLLHTFSDHIRLGRVRLADLTEDIRTVINGSYGGVVTRPYRSVLRMGRRTPQARDVEFRWS